MSEEKKSIVSRTFAEIERMADAGAPTVRTCLAHFGAMGRFRLRSGSRFEDSYIIAFLDSANLLAHVSTSDFGMTKKYKITVFWNRKAVDLKKVTGWNETDHIVDISNLLVKIGRNMTLFLGRIGVAPMPQEPQRTSPVTAMDFIATGTVRSTLETSATPMDTSSDELESINDEITILSTRLYALQKQRDQLKARER